MQRWKRCSNGNSNFILLFLDKCNREDLCISPRNPNDGATQYLNKIPWQCGCGDNYEFLGKVEMPHRDPEFLQKLTQLSHNSYVDAFSYNPDTAYSQG